jgi:hypothetical protein
MMNNMIPYIIFGIPALIGAFITSKAAGWPSEAEKKNKGVRSIKTSVGGTVLVISVVLLILYHTSPHTFWSKWSLLTVIGSVFNCVLPVFVLLTIGAYIQYIAWEKTESLMNKQLEKVLKSKTDVKK